jgi:hypothetical protein
MMGKEVQNSMGNQVAIGKVSKVKRWVHPYNELYNLFFDWTQKKNRFFVCLLMLWQNINLMDPMGFLFVCYGLWKNFQFDAPQCPLLFVYLCYNNTFNMMDPMGFLFMCYDLTFNLIDPWGLYLYVMIYGKTFDGPMGVMDTTFTWQMEFIHINVNHD